jgi:hypothetical protein
MVPKGQPPLVACGCAVVHCAHLTVTSFTKLLYNRTWSRTVVTWTINLNMALCIKLTVLTVFWTIIWIYALLFRDLLCRDSLDCGENAVPTSRVCTSHTVIQMFTEYYILCHHAALQWHNFMTKYHYYQWIISLPSRGRIHEQLSDCLAYVSPEFPFLIRKWNNNINENVKK